MELVRGKKTKVNIVSILAEVARISLQQGLEFSPTLTEEKIMEFDNEEAAVIINTLDSFDATLTYLESSDKAVACAIMGLPMNSAVVPLNPAYFKEVAWFANLKAEDGKIFRSFCAKPGTVKGNPTSVQVDGNKNAKALALSHGMIYDIFGAEVVHQKFASTDFAQTGGTGPYQASLSATPVELPALTVGETAQTWLFVRKNGEVVTDGFTITAGKLGVGDTAPEVTDVWEVFFCKTPA